MAASGTLTPMDRFVQTLRRSGLIPAERLESVLEQLRAEGKLTDQPQTAAIALVQRGLLSRFQAQQLLQGRSRGFILGGKYKLLELLGQGGMGSVFLCEQTTLRRLVAVKILPAEEMAKDPALLERFYREARAVAALTHPNLVRAYDIDQDGQQHFLVMEFIDGINLHDLVSKKGPLPFTQAAHYIAQAAAGLQRAHVAGWVHRDIKPGNLLLDRSGIVKVLDLGLARLRNNQGEQLTQKYDDQATMGTADYLSPEQALHASDVDIRADLYSLGGTFYFLLAGQSPFADLPTVAQKLLAHQMKEPPSLLELRPDTPRELNLIIKKLMRKQPSERFQTPADLVAALEPWTSEPLELPPADVMPKWTPIVRALLATRAEGPISTSLTPTVTEAGSPTRPIPVTPVVPPRSSAHKMPRPAVAPEPALPSGPATKAPRPKKVKKKQTLPTWVVTTILGSLTLICLVVIIAVVASSKPRVLSEAEKRVTVPTGLGAMPSAPLPTAPAVGAKPPSDGRVTHYVADATAPPPPGAQHVFESIAAALEKAPPGARIIVLPEVIRESLVLEDGRRGRRVTIEAGPSRDGKPILWRPSPTPTRSSLITISNLDGLVIRGFQLDGNDDAVEEIVSLSGRCPGVRFEQCSFNQYKKQAVTLTDALGAENAPITFQRTRFQTGQKNQRQAAIFFLSTQPDLGNQHVLVDNCRFEGYFKAGLHFQGSAQNVRVERCRFYTPPPPQREPKREHQPSDAILIENAPRVRLWVTNNTYLRFAAGIALRPPLPQGGSQIIFRNNLILSMHAAVAAGPDGQQLSATEAAALFPQFEGNLCRPTTCQGGVASLRPTPATDIERLSDGVDDDSTFLRYQPSSSLMQRGVGGGPVGAPPD